jgi:hypothetical protein
MNELWGNWGALAAIVAVAELAALAAILHRPGRRGGSSLVADASRLGLRTRVSPR